MPLLLLLFTFPVMANQPYRTHNKEAMRKTALMNHSLQLVFLTAPIWGLLTEEEFKPDDLIPRMGIPSFLPHNWIDIIFFIFCSHFTLLWVFSNQNSYWLMWSWLLGMKTVFILFSEVFWEKKNVLVNLLYYFQLFLLLLLLLNFIYLFIYLFRLRWVFVAVCRLSLVEASWGYSLLRRMGFSLRWLLVLRSTGSRHAGFSSCSTWAQ